MGITENRHSEYENKMNEVGENLMLFAEYTSVLNVINFFCDGVKVNVPVKEAAAKVRIIDMNLSNRSKNGLLRNSIYTVGDLSALIKRDGSVFRVKNIGIKSAEEIETQLMLLCYEYLSEKERKAFWRYVYMRNKLSA